MPKKYKGKTPQQIMAAIQQTIKRLPLQVAAEAATEFQKNFDRQRFFTDPKWKDRKGGNAGRAILIGSGSGNLRGAIEFDAAQAKARVYVNPPYDKYGAVHNNGGSFDVKVTTQMRKWAWAMFYRTGSEMYKGIALSKKQTFTIKMPKRQFIGNHIELDKVIKQFVEVQIKTAIQ